MNLFALSSVSVQDGFVSVTFVDRHDCFVNFNVSVSQFNRTLRKAFRKANPIYAPIDIADVHLILSIVSLNRLITYLDLLCD